MNDTVFFIYLDNINAFNIIFIAFDSRPMFFFGFSDQNKALKTMQYAAQEQTSADLLRLGLDKSIDSYVVAMLRRAC